MVIRDSQSQDIVHRIQPRFLPGDKLSRGQRAEGIAIPAAGFDGDFKGLAEQAENDRVLAGVVAGANGVITDLVDRSLADLALASVAMNGLTHRGGYNLAEFER